MTTAIACGYFPAVRLELKAGIPSWVRAESRFTRARARCRQGFGGRKHQVVRGVYQFASGRRRKCGGFPEMGSLDSYRICSAQTQKDTFFGCSGLHLLTILPGVVTLYPKDDLRRAESADARQSQRGFTRNLRRGSVASPRCRSQIGQGKFCGRAQETDAQSAAVS